MLLSHSCVPNTCERIINYGHPNFPCCSFSPISACREPRPYLSGHSVPNGSANKPLIYCKFHEGRDDGTREHMDGSRGNGYVVFLPWHGQYRYEWFTSAIVFSHWFDFFLILKIEWAKTSIYQEGRDVGTYFALAVINVSSSRQVNFKTFQNYILCSLVQIWWWTFCEEYWFQSQLV